MGICGSNMRLSDPGEAVEPPDELKESAAQVCCQRHSDCVGSLCACTVIQLPPCSIMQVPKQTMSVSASSTADMVRLKQGGKRGAIAAEAAARKEDLEIPDVPKSEADLQVIGTLPACWAVK